jgi:hypothetical protein
VVRVFETSRDVRDVFETTYSFTQIVFVFVYCRLLDEGRRPVLSVVLNDVIGFLATHEEVSDREVRIVRVNEMQGGRF